MTEYRCDITTDGNRCHKRAMYRIGKHYLCGEHGNVRNVIRHVLPPRPLKELRESRPNRTRCSVCNVLGHNRASCPMRAPQKGKSCVACESLPWRVLDGTPEWARVGRVCPRCGLAYAAEVEPEVEMSRAGNLARVMG
jgi:hypothetical protein